MRSSSVSQNDFSSDFENFFRFRKVFLFFVGSSMGPIPSPPGQRENFRPRWSAMKHLVPYAEVSRFGRVKTTSGDPPRMPPLGLESFDIGSVDRQKIRFFKEFRKLEGPVSFVA